MFGSRATEQRRLQERSVQYLEAQAAFAVRGARSGVVDAGVAGHLARRAARARADLDARRTRRR